jgi:hypothetical protein
MPSNLTRRQLLRGFAAAAPLTAVATRALAGLPDSVMADTGTNVPAPYAKEVLPSGVRSRFVHGINGLRMHVLEAGYEDDSRPGILLLHGFPELA